MDIIVNIFLILGSILSFFLVLPFFTVLVAQLFGKEKLNKKTTGQTYDFGCIITAYKNAEIAKPLIQSLLKQNYNEFHIYLVADECDISNWNIKHDKLTVFNPQPPLRLKAKSIIHAMDNYVRKHDFTAIFDADNLAPDDFLQIINNYALNGHLAIQGQRTAKNLDNMHAIADSIGEFYKNYIERYAPYLIGSSSVISGSGMAVETNLYRSYLDSPEIQQGKEKWKKMLQEDKILQNFLIKRNEKIVYAWGAKIYDEKVVTGNQVETQRSRWLFSYFQNLTNSSAILLQGIKNLSFNQFFFGLMTISPPLFILIAITLFVAFISLFIVPSVSYLLVSSLVVFSLNLLWTLKLSKVPKEIWKGIWGLPIFVVNQFKGLLKMGNPNKNFKHSEHTRNVSIEEIMKKDK